MSILSLSLFFIYAIELISGSQGSFYRQGKIDDMTI